MISATGVDFIMNECYLCNFFRFDPTTKYLTVVKVVIVVTIPILHYHTHEHFYYAF